MVNQEMKGSVDRTGTVGGHQKMTSTAAAPPHETPPTTKKAELFTTHAPRVRSVGSEEFNYASATLGGENGVKEGATQRGVVGTCLDALKIVFALVLLPIFALSGFAKNDLRSGCRCRGRKSQ